jgi:hypothetical protein
LSTAFPSAIAIDGLTFFEGQVLNNGVPAGGTYTLSFSYTSAAPGGLNLTNPSANIGSGSQGFSAAPVTVSVSNKFPSAGWYTAPRNPHLFSF